MPLIEIDEDRDNLFVTVRDLDYLSGIYVSIKLDSDIGMYNIWLNDRGHSGGDPTFADFSFIDNEVEPNLPKICDLYKEAPKY